MILDVSALSDRFSVRRLLPSDAPAMLTLAETNRIYYQYHAPAPSLGDMLDGLTALPPGKTAEDKYYVGFFSGGHLAAILDLVLHYPQENTAFIGLFMLDAADQGKGLGSAVSSGVTKMLSYRGFEKVRLAIDKGNPQSEAFWTKNGFRMTGEEYPNDFSAYLPMERPLTKERRALTSHSEKPTRQISTP